MAKITLSELKKGQMKQMISDLDELKKMGENNSDILNAFLDDFKEFENKAWPQQGRPFGKRWVGLSQKYKEWKLFNYNDSKADLTLTGALRDAATGGNGWFQKIDKNKAEWGINSNTIPYAVIHQLGGANMPQRPYMATVENDLPGPLQQRLINLIRKKLELSKVFKKAS